MTRRDTGREGEKLARRYYKRAGYTLVEANYHTRMGEVDLIVKKGGMLVFAEVKARHGGIAPPAAFVDGRKQQRILLAAQHYIMEHNLPDPPMRFDVVEVYFTEGKKPVLNCIENAFGA